MNIILALFFAYLIGSISVGYIAGRLRGIDIREHGSGSAGTTNTLRLLGVGPAIIVGILDLFKGIAAIYLARGLTDIPLIIMLSGVAVVAGHNWPLFFGFRGGRGIIPTAGVLVALAPNVIIIITIIGITTVALTRYVSLGSIIGAIFVPVLMLAYSFPWEYVFFGFVLAVLAVWRHRPNIKRLLNGTESKLGSKVLIEEKKVEK